MQQLIPLHTQHIDGDATQTVNARELHTFLEVGKDFSTWINARIQQYGFLENQDFVTAPQNGGAVYKGGGHNRKDYHITLDMAKELAMVERNEKGREARRYFIACEKALREQQVLQPTAKPLTMAQRANRGIAAARHFTGMMRATEAMPVSRRRAALAANQATLEVIGMDLLSLMGISPEELDDTPNTPDRPVQIEEDTFASQLQRWLAEPEQAKRRQFSSEDIMAGLHGPVPPSNSRALATRIGQAMARLGWPKRRLPPDSQGHRAWVYCRPN